jgi:hypothetical protein
MSRHLKKLATIMTLIAMLAATSLAAPMCDFCAPAAAQHHTIQPTRPVHDHCGAMHAESADGSRVSQSNCTDNGVSCVTFSGSVNPAMALASSVHLFVPAQQATEPSPAGSDSLRNFIPAYLSPTPPLLTTTLRI